MLTRHEALIQAQINEIPLEHQDDEQRRQLLLQRHDTLVEEQRVQIDTIINKETHEVITLESRKQDDLARLENDHSQEIDYFNNSKEFAFQQLKDKYDKKDNSSSIFTLQEEAMQQQYEKEANQLKQAEEEWMKSRNNEPTNSDVNLEECCAMFKDVFDKLQNEFQEIKGNNELAKRDANELNAEIENLKKHLLEQISLCQSLIHSKEQMKTSDVAETQFIDRMNELNRWRQFQIEELNENASLAM